MKVSISVVALNEEKYLHSILHDIIQQSYPHEDMEILLIDSISQDKTKEIMLDFANKYRNDFWQIKVLDNAGKRLANGWNVALRNYEGEVIIRIDAHAHVPKDFVAKNITRLKAGEYVCGGRRPSIAEEDTLSAKLLLAAESAVFGSGISAFRNSEKSGYVKSIFHGAYRREVFDKVGFFDERLGRTEDNDIHQRIRAAGYKIFMDKDIVSYQYVRSTLRKMLKQKFMNGYWIGRTMYVNPACISMYYFVPLIFVVALAVSIALLVNGNLLMFELIAIPYSLLMLISAIAAIKENKWNLSFIGIAPVCFLMHICYGVGTIKGLLKL